MGVRNSPSILFLHFKGNARHYPALGGVGTVELPCPSIRDEAVDSPVEKNHMLPSWATHFRELIHCSELVKFKLGNYCKEGMTEACREVVRGVKCH